MTVKVPYTNAVIGQLNLETKRIDDMQELRLVGNITPTEIKKAYPGYRVIERNLSYVNVDVSEEMITALVSSSNGMGGPVNE